MAISHPLRDCLSADTADAFTVTRLTLYYITAMFLVISLMVSLLQARCVQVTVISQLLWRCLFLAIFKGNWLSQRDSLYLCAQYSFLW